MIEKKGRKKKPEQLGKQKEIEVEKRKKERKKNKE